LSATVEVHSNDTLQALLDRMVPEDRFGPG
jgi:hypothetical protein